MILNFRQLEVFRAIMVAKTISGAAEMLHVSQPGISRLLKYMEYKLGITLFERHKGRLLPTPEAQELFRELDPVFRRIESMDVVIRRIINKDDMEFKIACTPSLATYVLPRLLEKLKVKMPGVKVLLESLPNEVIAEYITQRNVDFAIAHYAPDHPLLLSEPTISLAVECVLPMDHPLVGRNSVTFEDMFRYPIVSYFHSTMFGTILTRAGEKLGREPDTSVVVRYANEACNMVERGLGITIATQFTVLPDRYPGLRSIPIKSEKLQLHFLRHNGIPMSNNLKNLYDLLKTEIRTLK